MNKVFVIGYSFTFACMTAHAYGAGSLETMQKKLGIPPSEGIVVDASGHKPDIILIQDVHRHPEAQQHIRAMIVRAMTSLGAHDIFLEGAWTHGQTADYAYSGLEDADTYRANVAAYEAVEKEREEALQEIDMAQLLGNTFDAASSPDWPQLKRLVQLHLKPAEYAEYLQHPFRPQTSSPLARVVLSAESFYAIANERSTIFLQKAKEHHSSGPQILVVGGFHTADMAARLRKEGISFVVLSPLITQGGFEDLYSKGMHQTISALKLH